MNWIEYSKEKEIYFELENHDLVSGTKLREIMSIVNGYVPLGSIPSNTEVRAFAKTCKGIVREIKHPSVTKLIEYGHESTAIHLYYKENSGISLVVARDDVRRWSDYINKRKIKY